MCSIIQRLNLIHLKKINLLFSVWKFYCKYLQLKPITYVGIDSIFWNLKKKRELTLIGTMDIVEVMIKLNRIIYAPRLYVSKERRGNWRGCWGHWRGHCRPCWGHWRWHCRPCWWHWRRHCRPCWGHCRRCWGVTHQFYYTKKPSGTEATCLCSLLNGLPKFG